MPTSVAPSHGTQPPGAAAHTAGAGPRVTPATAASAIQHRSAGQAAADALPASSRQVSGVQVARQVSAQLLLSMIQNLGKPLSGTVTAVPQASASTRAGAEMQIQLSMTTSGAAPKTSVMKTGAMNASTASTGTASTGAAPNQRGADQTLSVRLPLPAGQSAPAPGTPVTVSAVGDGLTVSVRGPAPMTSESLRADAARQASMAPLMADVAKLAAKPQPSPSIDTALARIMGMSLSGDDAMSADSLRASLDGARGLPAGPISGAGSAGQGTSLSAGGMQGALSALIRALGLAQQPSLPTETVQGPSPQDDGAGSPPPRDAGRPSKLPSVPLPGETPDLADPSQVQGLQRKAEGALSRLNLLQNLGLEGQRGADQAHSLRWDVPLLLGQEAAVLGLAVDHDGGASGSDGAPPDHWRFRFAFESTAHGGVEGLVAMRMVRTAGDGGTETQSIAAGDPVQLDVAVWVTEHAMLRRLDAARGRLAAALERHGLLLTSLTIAPADAAPARVNAGSSDDDRHLVDVAS